MRGMKHDMKKAWGGGIRSRLVAVVAALAMLGTSVAAGTAVASELTADDAQTPTTAQTAEQDTQNGADASDDASVADVVEPSSDDDVRSADAVAQDDGSALYAVGVPVGQGDAAGSLGVEVTVPAGALPDGVALVAGSVADADAVSFALAGAGVEYDGLLAVDVRFEDADGNEVEPDGKVDVKFEMPQAALGDDVDASTLAVQHLAEDENGDVTKVDAVADAGDATQGTVKTTDDKATADFTVDSFSAFTITWNGRWSGDGSHPMHFTCYYTGTNNALPDSDHPDSFMMDNDKEVVFSQSDHDSRLDIDGYTYDHAEYRTGDHGSWQTLNKLSVSHKTVSGWNYYVNGNKANNEPQVRLFYTKNSSGGDEGGTTPGEGTNATVQTGKTAVLRDDGNYDLTLSISGDRGSATTPAPVDVLFIVDRSNSMTNNRSPRLQNAKNAMETLVNSLEGNANIDAQYSIVTFSGPDDFGDSNKKNDASVHMDWTAVSGNNVSNSIDRITASGGTDYQAGLEVGTDQLNAVGARAGATKVVIFLSDGQPTWSYNYGTGGSALCLEYHWWERNCTYQGWLDTLNQAAKISCDYFYAIGIGSSSNSYLDGLVNSVHATTKQRIEAADDGSNLKDLFDDIAGEVSFFAAQNVTITDPLSEYADLVLTDNAPQFTVSVTNGTQTWSGTVAAGESVTFKDAAGNDQTATARVSSDNRTIYLDLPASYQLEEGYTYSISTVITPSQAAKDAGMNSDAAKQTPDTGTGTHADKGEEGFWSNANANAKVTYTANGEDGSENFPKPVIQVTDQSYTLPGSEFVTVKKTIEGRPWIDADGFSFKLEAVSPADAPMPSQDTVEITNKSTPVEGNDASFTAQFGEIIFPGPGEYTYTLSEESGGDHHGLDYSTQTYTITVNYEAGQTPTVTISPSNEEEPNVAEFVNTLAPYKYAKDHLGLFKRMVGSPLHAGDYSFTLADVSRDVYGDDTDASPSGGMTLPADADRTVTNLAPSAGSDTASLADFGEIDFTKPGSYVVSVTENKPAAGEPGYQDGVSYDPKVLYVRYDMTLVDGALKMSRFVYVSETGPVTDWSTVPEGSWEPDNIGGKTDVTDDDLTWTNVLKVSNLPLTGGDATARTIVLAGGGVLLLAGLAWLLARRRRV